jgi:hypothetical protein
MELKTEHPFPLERRFILDAADIAKLLEKLRQGPYRDAVSISVRYYTEEPHQNKWLVTPYTENKEVQPLLARCIATLVYEVLDEADRTPCGALDDTASQSAQDQQSAHTANSSLTSHPRIQGFIAGRSSEDARYWVVTVTTNLNRLHHRNIRVAEIRAGVELKRNDSVDFVIQHQDGKCVAADAALLVD